MRTRLSIVAFALAAGLALAAGAGAHHHPPPPGAAQPPASGGPPAMARTDHLALIDAMVRDDASAISTDDKLRALEHAVARYGLYRPRHLVADLGAIREGIVTNDLRASLDAYGERSQVLSVEWPVGEVPAMFTAHETYELPTGKTALYASAVPETRTVRITFVADHVVDDTTDTVPAADREAVAAWAAAELLDQLAARAAGRYRLDAPRGRGRLRGTVRPLSAHREELPGPVLRAARYRPGGRPQGHAGERDGRLLAPASRRGRPSAHAPLLSAPERHASPSRARHPPRPARRPRGEAPRARVA